MIDVYFQQLLKVLAITPVVRTPNVTFDKRSARVGFIRGEVHFIDDSQLHFRELVYLLDGPERVMYAYHYQGTDKSLIFRYDNIEHFPELPNFPHHKHIGDDVVSVIGELPNLQTVVDEITEILQPG
ncbi:MAG: hypothetical protein KJ638_10955 [Chloroflexi bacterium]|nr:hypothetical protein [Chloroflexota bacterium]